MQTYVFQPAELAILLNTARPELPLDETAQADLGIDRATLVAAAQALRARGLLVESANGESEIEAGFARVIGTLLAPEVLCMLRMERPGGQARTVNFSCTADALVVNRVDGGGRHLIGELATLDELSAAVVAAAEPRLAAEAPKVPAHLPLDRIIPGARTVSQLTVAALPSGATSPTQSLAWLEARGRLWLVDSNADSPVANVASREDVERAIGQSVRRVMEAAGARVPVGV